MKKYLFIFIALTFITSTPLVYAATPTSTKSVASKPVDVKVSKNIDSLNAWREDTYKQIKDEQIKTQSEIKLLESSDKSKNTGNAKLLDATEKPIDYIKLFFLAIFAFVFASSLVFYVVIALLAFIILRFIYKKIRNR